MIRRLALLLALAAAPSLFAADTWVIDRPHSDVSFKVRHFVSNAIGRFGEFEGTVVADADKPQASSVEFKIKSASIDTDNPDRDKHLRSADFFDVEKFPEITFKSTKIQPAGTNKFNVTGDLSIHGVTKQVTLPVTFLGSMKLPNGSEKGGFETSTVINRKDYGLMWNRAIESGGFLLGEDVTISINLEVNRKKPEPAPAASK